MKKKLLLLAGLSLSALIYGIWSNKENENNKEIGTLVYTAADTFEADRVIASLQAAGIPAYIKENGAGQVFHMYAGYSKFGVEIFVPEDAVLTAKSVIEEMGLI